VLESLALWLLLPAGIALGIYFGRKPRAAADSSAMIEGLTLAQDNPDRAIAALTKALERDPAAVELNLTLGTLFRKRGEIDRALRLHEGVVAQAGLKPDTKALALYELGQDCVKAGLLDRAEEALQKAAKHPAFEALACEQLLVVHEQSGKWHEAGRVAAQLETAKSQPRAVERAHYLIERAEAATRDGDAAEASRLAGKALETDPRCVRASLFLAAQRAGADDWQAALDAYAKVAEQDARFIPEIVAPAQQLCAAPERQAVLLSWLDALEAAHPLEPSLWLARAQLTTDVDEKSRYLAVKLSQRPSWQALVQFLGLPAAQQAGVLSEPVGAFRAALAALIAKRPRYLCHHCGFTPSLLFWRCPSCRQWGSVTPADERL